MSEAYILDAVRTPRGKGKTGKGALSGIHPQELFAQAIAHVVDRNKIARADIEDVIAGAVSQVDEQGCNLARNAVLTAGFPVEVPGVTLNRFCGSGLQAVQFAAANVKAGVQDLVVAGGAESMSRVPMGSDGGNGDGNNEVLRKRYFQVPQGVAADLIATLEGFSRDDVDRFALASQQKAAAAAAAGRFERSLIPVVDPKTGAVVLRTDETYRADTTLEGLSKLPASFAAVGDNAVGFAGETLDQLALVPYAGAGAISHVHTAGNSSGLADGAAAVLVASEAYVKRTGVKPRARVVSIGVTGSEPVIMLTAPAAAVEIALRKAGLRATDIDLWEINEAFAAVAMQVTRKLGLDPAKVNVNGGAIALGHPLGATGAMLLGTAVDELERTGKRYGGITLCIAGGQGVALIVERT